MNNFRTKANKYHSINHNKFSYEETTRHKMGYRNRTHRKKVDWMRRECALAAGGKPYKEYQKDYVHYKREVRRGEQHAEWYCRAWTYVRAVKSSPAKYRLGESSR